jgi:hypothetical protein
MLLCFLSLFKIESKVTETSTLALISCVLILVAAFRGEGFDRDYNNYKEIFLLWDESSTYLIEPGFIVIANFARIFFSTPILLFLLFALLGVSIKVYSINKLTDFVFISLLIYFCNIYILQDLTQIRAGVASGLMLISLVPLKSRKKTPFFIVAFLAIMFHYTAFVILPFWFFKVDKINKKIWFTIIPFSYLLLFLAISPLDLYELIPIDSIQAKIRTYILLQEADTENVVNVFSTLVFIRLLFISYILKKIDIIQEENKYAIIVIKIYIISIAVLVVMSKTTAIALRFNEFFSAVEIVALPLILYAIEPGRRIYARILLVVMSAILLFFHYRAATLLIFE